MSINMDDFIDECLTGKKVKKKKKVVKESKINVTDILSEADDSAVLVAGIGTGLLSLGLRWAGYSKLKKAGQKLNFGLTQEGVGVTINLNK
jgi:hypothetical protein